MMLRFIRQTAKSLVGRFWRGRWVDKHNQSGASIVEASVVLLLCAIFCFALIRLFIGFFIWFIVQYSVISGIRSGLIAATSSLSLPSSVDAAVIGQAAAYGVTLTPDDIMICPVVGYDSCTMDSVGPLGSSYIVRASVTFNILQTRSLSSTSLMFTGYAIGRVEK